MRILFAFRLLSGLHTCGKCAHSCNLLEEARHFNRLNNRLRLSRQGRQKGWIRDGTLARKKGLLGYTVCGSTHTGSSACAHCLSYGLHIRQYYTVRSVVRARARTHTHTHTHTKPRTRSRTLSLSLSLSIYLSIYLLLTHRRAYSHKTLLTPPPPHTHTHT